MTVILGHLALDGTPVPERSRSFFHPRAANAAYLIRAPLLESAGTAAVAITGEPHFASGAGGTGSLPERLLAAWREEGTAMLRRLRGPFALAMVDPPRRRALLAIDRMGIERLAWGTSGEHLAFGTSALDVAKLLSPAPPLNTQAFFDFMLAHMIPAPETAFAGVQKLLPATAVEFDGASVTHVHYWNPDFRRHGNDSVAELRTALLPTLRAAIAAKQPNGHTGSFLSGGLDSSTVTGLLAELRSGQSDAFSVGFGVPEFDELAYARIAAQRFGCRHHEYEVTADDVVRIIPEIAGACDEPFGNSSSVPTLAAVELAQRHGMNHVLAGDGGDELFGGNERYVSQRAFELYTRLPALLRRSLLDPLAGLFHPEDSFLPLRKFASYVHQSNIPLPERYESWNLVYREGADKIFAPGFIERVDPLSPIRRMHAVWNSCPSGELLDQMLWYDWKFILADNDLRKVKQMCELRGVKISFPMLDEAVVELSLQIPSEAKIQGKELRSFYKEATRGFLPEEIIRKKKHGFGLPFGHWLKTHQGLQELAYGSLDSLEKRDLFLPEFLRKVAREHKQGHPGYYGYAIWDLLMLEQWLETHETRSGVSLP